MASGTSATRSGVPAPRAASQFVLSERVGRCRVYCRNGRYYVRWYEPRPKHGAGCPRHGQAGDQPCRGPFDNLVQARQNAQRIDRSLMDGESGDGVGRLTVGTAVERLIELYSQDPACSPKTARAYAGRLAHFLEFCAEKKPRFTFEHITPALVADFELWLQARVVSPNGHANAAKRLMRPGYRKHVLQAASMLFEKAQAHGWVSAARGNPFRSRAQGRRRNPEQFPGFEFCCVDESILRDFLAACDPFQHRLFLLMLSSGLRTDEVRHMLIEKINWERRCYVLDPMVEELGYNTKNGRYRLIPILSQMEELFLSLRGSPPRRGVLILDQDEFLVKRPDEFAGTASLEDMKAAYSRSICAFREKHSRAPNPAEQEDMSEAVFLAAGALHRKRVYKEFMKVLRKMKLGQHLWPHLTRHIVATQAQQGGVDRFVARCVLGHSSDAVFDGYCGKSTEFMHKEWAKVLGSNTVIADALAHFSAKPPTAAPSVTPQPLRTA